MIFEDDFIVDTVRKIVIKYYIHKLENKVLKFIINEFIIVTNFFVKETC